MSNEVYIIGAGETKFGELWDKSLRNLAVEAGLKAVEDAGIYSKDIDAIYGANSLAGIINMQENIGALIADFSGLSAEGIPSLRGRVIYSFRRRSVEGRIPLHKIWRI
ncbi:hypothetical protein [Ferroplasma acidiphilum]|uniref:hypothetical protein n=1 Tax=Ferroplasma acidiphilum TaxID=74969 RepID=UPI0023F32894|nr:hypothetical protein [Ferroplasma acidiphilum]